MTSPFVTRIEAAAFAELCSNRGYTLEEVLPCVLSQDGTLLTVDFANPFFPKAPKYSRVGLPEDYASPASSPQLYASGPGAELHALLKRFGITAKGDCKCDSRVAYMNRMEAEQPGWCEANIDEIVGWLRESAAERGLPFLDVAARVLIRRAIANARRKEAARAEGSPHHDRGEAVAPPLHNPQG